ncbi:MAG: alpha/beta fold hydrolase [Candidatus Spechtbacterales bacterium]
MIKVELETEDGIKISGDYYEGSKSDSPAVILLHMMPATKESWRGLAPILTEQGFQVLAIDERGHGQSTMGGSLDFRNFSGAQQQAKMLDVVAAREFFLEKGVVFENIFIGGASIGANLAIQYLAENPKAKAGFALSPGYNYYGIQTLPFMERLSGDQSVFLAASQNDPNVSDSYKAVEELANIGMSKKEVKIFETGGHGTNIFEEHPDLMDELAEWLAVKI